MAKWASALDCVPYEWGKEDLRFRMTDYFGRPTDTSIGGAQSHLVEPLDFDAVITRHYHVQDQYQVFVNTVGKFGRQELTAPISIQYADAYTPYGPFHASDGKGLHFITVRLLADPGPYMLSDAAAREKRKGKGGRQGVWNLSERGGAPPGDAEIIAEYGDGVGIYRLTLDPGQVATGHELGNAFAQFNIIIGGAVVHDERIHPALTHILVEDDEPAVKFQAGDNGAEVLVLGFRKPVPDS